MIIETEMLKNNKHEPTQTLREVAEEKFNPYEFNAGTSLGIIHDNKIILASDLRHSSEMGINSRNATKIYQIGNYFLVLTGFYADGYEIYLNLYYAQAKYEIQHGSVMSIKSLAHYLHNELYQKRFFPYYSYSILGGFDKDKPYLFCYDPVGSYENGKCFSVGTGAEMVQPLLDSFISGKNRNERLEGNFDDVMKLVKVAFNAATERDVKTGDGLEMVVITSEGSERIILPLRKD